NFVPFGKIYKNQRGLTPKVRFLADFWVSPKTEQRLASQTHSWVFKRRCSVTRQSDAMTGKDEKC
ncbi:hypothetical protein, partial [Geobacillus stearothermophilus]|uniref:hypothetical protein n=1 Tax=Geobacillus stearothermophilus TaxID=1422 RepID=UPI002E231881|nr:hypothetical protein [Geobacillus stearothermophilus]